MFDKIILTLSGVLFGLFLAVMSFDNRVENKIYKHCELVGVYVFRDSRIIKCEVK